MFGIGSGELIFIILIALMLFGADKIPDIARTLGKGMAQLKNATNDIKSEITNSVDKQDFEFKSLTSKFHNEVNQVKDSVTKATENIEQETPDNVLPIEKEEQSTLDDISGPIKRKV